MFVSYFSQANCSFCQFIHNTEEFNPPLLGAKTEYQVILRSEWVSTKCEVRKVHFVTRHLVFHNNFTWEGYFFYYLDPMCQHPVYSIYVKGTHSDGTKSEAVMGGTEFEFVTNKMWITPQNVIQVDKLNNNQNDCARAGSWTLNEPQEVTSTNGCAPIGVTLPHTELELMRMEQGAGGRALLFNGLQSTDEELQGLVGPTSYQSPLMHCAGVNPLIDITVTSQADDESGCGGLTASSYTLLMLLLGAWLVLFLRH